MLILIADKSVSIRARLVAAVEQSGGQHTVMEADNLEQVLAGWVMEGPDLLLADMASQSHRGLATLARLRDRFPETYIVAMVNDYGGGVKTKLKEKGANVVMDKALEHGLLLETLQKLLG